MKFLKKEITGPFTTVAGIRTTNPEAIVEFERGAPDAIGIVTSKCYSEEPRYGYELPIMGDLFNAVGLSNPGSERGHKELSEIRPEIKRKKLSIQVMGETVEEFARVAGKMSEVGDYIEVNVSCPHSSLVLFGQDPDLTYQVTKAVREAVDKDVPIIIKLSPNVADIGKIAQAAVKGGADAISAINTVAGYFTDPFDGKKILGNPTGQGGISGPATKPIGLMNVRKIRAKIPKDMPIIGMGGIETARDVQDYDDAGANLFGLGSVFRMMDTKKSFEYIQRLNNDLTDLRKTGVFVDTAGELVAKGLIANYHTFEITEIETLTPDLKIFYTDKELESKPGQIAMIRKPGDTERPFSIVPLDGVWAFAIKRNGKFTSQLLDETKEGDKWRIRGPYGKPFPKHDYHIVAGGCGAAPALSLAQECDNPTIYLGAKTNKELLFVKEFQTYGKVRIATDDGSAGLKGKITDLLDNEFDNIPDWSYFANAAKEQAMVKTVGMEMGITSPEKIYATVERIWGCGGLGICFKCLGTCVDGPVYNYKQLAEKQWWGNYTRNKAGIKERI